jgi:hypothetical protein
MLNLLLLKANKLSTRKKDSKMNHRGVLTAEEQGSSRETTITVAAAVAAEEAASAAAETDGRNQGELMLSFFYIQKQFIYIDLY